MGSFSPRPKNRLACFAIVGAFAFMFSGHSPAGAQPPAPLPPQPAAGEPATDESQRKSILDMDIEALAKVDVLKPTPTDPVVEAISKAPEKVSEAPGIVHVITAEDIQQFGARNLQQVLNWATSVYTTGSYLFPRNVTSIRGDLLTLTDNHVLVLINGRPFREIVQGGLISPVYTAFPVDTIERVEVIRGPGSVLYGSNAFVGVINVVTKDPERPMLRFSALAGTFGTQQYSLSGGNGGKRAGMYAGATQIRQKGWPFEATSEDPPGPPTPEFDSTLYGEDNVGVFGMYRNGGLTANVFVADTSQEHFGPVPVWPSAEIDTSNVFLDVGYLHEICPHRSLDVHFTYNFNQFIFPFDALPPGIPMPDVMTTSHDFLLEPTFRTRLTEKMDLTVGGVFDFHLGESITGEPSLAGVSAFTEIWYGVYGQLEYRATEWLELVGGVQGNMPGVIPGGVVPRADVIASLTDQWGAKFLYGQAFRSPYQIERSFVAPGILLGNPDLQPETIQTFEGQLSYRTKPFLLAGTYYHSDYFNLISRVGVSPATYANVGTMDFHGVELETNWEMLSFLRCFGSLTWQENVTGDGVFNTMHVPNWMGKLGLAYIGRNGLTVGVFDTAFSKPSEVTTVNPSALVVNPVPGDYHLLSLNATLDLDEYLHWHTGRSVMLQFLVQNLLDERIYHPEFGRREINSLPAHPGRAFYGGLIVNY